MGRRILRTVGFLVLAGAIYLVASAFILHRRVESAERRLEKFLEDPGIASVDLYRAPEGDDTTFGEVFTGKLLVLPPLQLLVDFDIWHPQYWKPFYAVSRDVLWSSELSPRKACEAVRTGLGIKQRCLATDQSHCLKGSRAAGMSVRPCYRLFEGGYTLPDSAETVRLEDETIGSLKFKRGGYREYGAAPGSFTPVPDRSLTIIQVFAEATEV